MELLDRDKITTKSLSFNAKPVESRSVDELADELIIKNWEREQRAKAAKYRAQISGATDG